MDIIFGDFNVFEWNGPEVAYGGKKKFKKPLILAYLFSTNIAIFFPFLELYATPPTYTTTKYYM